jgi:hypothetical protein
MTDATRGTDAPAKTRTASHFMKPTVAAELLRAQHGEENAPEDRVARAAEGETRAIPEALRVLGLGLQRKSSTR